MLYYLITFIQICSVICFFTGLILISFLQVKLSRKLGKSFISFIPLFLYPKKELSDREQQIRKIGGYLILFSAIAALLCSLDEIV